MPAANALLERLGIEHPIIQAPMASATTPALAVAVANAGGLGSLGCAMLSPDALRAQTAEVRAGTNRAFNLNFFVHAEPRRDAGREARMRERLAPFYAELGLGAVPQEAVPTPAFGPATLEAVLELRPPVVSFHFGLPAPAAVRAIKDAGIVVLSSATTVREARVLESAGVDAVIAQGWEAGGHRGTFDSPFEAARVGTLALVPQVVDAVGVPVIAAGGIADGRGVAAALVLGASAAQVGTAFLTCPESAIPPVHRDALLAARDEDTRLTAAFSGRPARGLANRYIESMAAHEHDLPDFPLPNALTGPLRHASAERGSGDFVAMWSGQAVGLCRAQGAAELVRRLVAETREALGR